MKNNKLFNIQDQSRKNNMKNNINEYEKQKIKSLLEIGKITFDKIRKNKVIDSDFDYLYDEIKNLDIEIYKNYKELQELEKNNIKISCECGHIISKDEKFCSQCGKSLIKPQDENIICINCDQEIDINSNFCPCCGEEISKEIIQEDNEDEVIEFLENHEDNIK